MSPEEHIEACTHARLAKLAREADEARQVLRRAYEKAFDALRRREADLRAELGRKPPPIPEETHRLLMSLSSGTSTLAPGPWREKALLALLELATKLARPDPEYVSQPYRRKLSPAELAAAHRQRKRRTA